MTDTSLTAVDGVCAPEDVCEHIAKESDHPGPLISCHRIQQCCSLCLLLLNALAIGFRTFQCISQSCLPYGLATWNVLWRHRLAGCKIRIPGTKQLQNPSKQSLVGRLTILLQDMQVFSAEEFSARKCL